MISKDFDGRLGILFTRADLEKWTTQSLTDDDIVRLDKALSANLVPGQPVVFMYGAKKTSQPEPANSKPLGTSQQSALRTLAERNNGRWWPGCGWQWANESSTRRIMESLARRGLAERVEDPNRPSHVEYVITDAGRAAARKVK